MGHYDVLSAFKDDYYRGLITKAHLGDETIIKVGENQKFIFPVKYRGKLFAIPSEIIEGNKLPIKVTSSKKVGYRSNVYHLVNKFASARIIEQKTKTYRELIDSIGDFDHTHKNTDWLIYKIAIITLYLRRGFMRVVSEAGFGKNSIPTILKALMTDVGITNPRSTAVFEYKLIMKMVVLDELTNLEKAQRDLMQEALLRVGDWSPTYEKGTRGSSKIGTKDEYDISKLSIVILYNIYEYYLSCNQQDKYFDNVFQPAVKDRFFPIYCEGILDGNQFETINKPIKYARELTNEIKHIIRAIKYYQNNFEREDKQFKLQKEYKLSKTGRFDKTFGVICQGFRMYSNNGAEYNNLTERLYQMHLRYIRMVAESDVEIIDMNAEITGSKTTKQQTLN